MIRELNLLREDIDLTWVNDNAMKLGRILTPGLEQYFCDILTLDQCKGQHSKKLIVSQLLQTEAMLPWRS